jgi:hypothetical protein
MPSPRALVFTLLIGVLVLCIYAAGSVNNSVLETTTTTTPQGYNYGWEIEPLFNPPRERLPTISQLREALSWIVDTDKCEAPINAVFIPLSTHYNGMGAWDFYITDDLKINISSGEVAKLADLLDLYTGQRLMVYFTDKGMIDRILWMTTLTDIYDGFIYVRVDESMLEQGYIVIEDLYWRDVRTTYRSPEVLVHYWYGNITYYCPARYNITWRNAVQVWQVYNLTLPWRPWGLATTVTVTETVTTTLPASTVTTTTTYTTTETITQTITGTTTLPPITITNTATETRSVTTTATATYTTTETSTETITETYTATETTTLPVTTTTTQHHTTTETVTAWGTTTYTSVKTETTTERETYTTTATIAKTPVETIATGALGALIGALIMALLLRKTP